MLSITGVWVFDDLSPLHRQVAERIKADVLAGTLQPDEQVMTADDFSAFYRLQRTVVVKAYDDLIDEGVLYRRRGAGVFVSPDASDRIRRERRERFFEDFLDPMVAEAKAIGVDIEEVMDRIRSGLGSS